MSRRSPTAASFSTGRAFLAFTGRLSPVQGGLVRLEVRLLDQGGRPAGIPVPRLDQQDVARDDPVRGGSVGALRRGPPSPRARRAPSAPGPPSRPAPLGRSRAARSAPTIARMTMASYGSAVSRGSCSSHSTAEMMVAASRMRTRTFWNCSSSRRHRGVSGALLSRFGPCRSRRRCASAGSRPRSASEPSAATTASAASLCAATGRSGPAAFSPLAAAPGTRLGCPASSGGCRRKSVAPLAACRLMVASHSERGLRRDAVPWRAADRRPHAGRPLRCRRARCPLRGRRSRCAGSAGSGTPRP